MKRYFVVLALLCASSLTFAQLGDTTVVGTNITLHVTSASPVTHRLVNNGTIEIDVAGIVINIADPSPSAVSGTGTFTGKSFSMRRAIQQGATAPYQFESNRTYIQFQNTGTYPSAITMMVYPDTAAAPFFAAQAPIEIPSHDNPAAHQVVADVPLTHFSTVRACGAIPPSILSPRALKGGERTTQSGLTYAVDRVYDFTPEGNSSGVSYNISMRYEASEFHGTDESQLKLYVSYPVNIPSLTMWGLVILALLIIGTASWGLMKKRTRLAVK